MFFLQMSGFPGSGKSTLALEIANRTGCIIINHDITKSALMDSNENEMIDGKVMGKIAYNLDFALADYYLSQGRSVILDSPCLYGEMLEKGSEISRKYKAEYKYIECYIADFSEINKRLKSRKKMKSQIAEVKSEKHFLNTIKNSKKPLTDLYLTVNSKEPLHTYIHEVMVYIES